MTALQLVLSVIVGGAALWLVGRPLLRPRVGGAGWDDVPDPEETRKGVALLALREIEFDREMGKLSEADYDQLRRAYTSEALAAQRLEEGKAARAPEPIEALIAARVLQLKGNAPHAGSSAPLTASCPSCGPRPESDALFCSECGRLLAGAPCARCGAPLRPDARFCEGCGAPVAGAA